MVKVFKHRFRLLSRTLLSRFLAEGYLLLGNQQQPGGKKKKGKKGEGNQNKPKPTRNADGGKKDKNKLKFPCKLCQEDHLTHQFHLMEQAQKLLKTQKPTVLKDPFPEG